ncbi:FAD-binding protein [Aetokthonos hydrillicola Thurmond2011]|jgi:hypothetical protein|uniref:FAD-binding protein n=3 Tax=Aetokthonos TaxID=1550243 RepID=A0AAP5M847_9CYAN|nr:FAD-binding protein [Aetokthonos hydrillicola]MBW4589605.1 FAD-binding protein [Aetokthonos hydrillicola CCALA 1050]MDR9893208.1 FAD-binding protein [Aetokthonos hydrillicola Thurmond2011]
MPKQLASIITQLRQGIVGEVTDIVPESYQADFGRLRHKQPSILVTATCEADIVHALKVAQDNDIPITVRGAGHSCNGQSLCNGGIILKNFIPEAQAEWLSENLVEVTGRSRWREVELLLNQSGRQTKVLTDYLDMSVGGTLSVGGIGMNSIISGFQVDNVSRLRLIQLDGRSIWCSPQENGDLFRFALAGLGQVGIIEKVVMKTDQHCQYTHVIKRKHSSLSEMLSFLPEIASPDNGIQHFNGYIYPEEISSEYGYFSNEKELNPSRLESKLIQDSGEISVHQDFPLKIHTRRDIWLSSFSDHVRLWTDYIFNYDGIVRFMQFLEPQLAEPPLSETLKAMYILMIRRPSNYTNFAFLPAPPGELLFSVGMYTMVNRWHPVLIAKSLDSLQNALVTCCALGGRPYLYGCSNLDHTTKHKLYRDDYPKLLNLRSYYRSVLNAESW